MSVDKFADGYEACFAFVEEKVLDTSLIQLSDYAEASAAKETAEAKDVEVEELTSDGDDQEKKKRCCRPLNLCNFVCNQCWP